MKNLSKIYYKFPLVIYQNLIIVFVLLLLIGCTASEKQMQVAQFKFEYEGNHYLIRSLYCPNNPRSCNHLIGDDFVAVDLNQDRIIDEVIRGDITTNKAQIIYDYSLNLLERDNKLIKVQNNSEELKYIFKRQNFIFEITTYILEIGEPFNQFKVVDNRLGKKRISLFNDLKVDGRLDEKLSGSCLIVDAQKYYEETIEEGLIANKIVRVENTVRVK
ncbi:MAG: hypothetical protein ABFS12_05510 [Bacteroidota bacterium]